MDIIDVDHLVPDVASPAPSLAPHQVFCGKADPVALVERGSMDQLAAATREMHRQSGGRCIVSAGCEITPGTSPQRMREYRGLCDRLSLITVGGTRRNPDSHLCNVAAVCNRHAFRKIGVGGGKSPTAVRHASCVLADVAITPTDSESGHWAGNIVVPKPLRDRFGLHPGMELEIEAVADGFRLRALDVVPPFMGKEGVLIHHDTGPAMDLDVKAFINRERTCRPTVMKRSLHLLGARF